MQDRSIFFGESEWNEMVEYRYRDESRCRLVTFQSGCPLVFALESGGGFLRGLRIERLSRAVNSRERRWPPSGTRGDRDEEG